MWLRAGQQVLFVRKLNTEPQRKKALYLHARFDTILEPNAVFPMEFLLNDNFYKKVHWTSQTSGMSVPDAVAGKLEKDWAKFINQPVPFRKVDYADEIDGVKSIYETATKQVEVNIYERNAEARAICNKEIWRKLYSLRFWFW